MTAEKLPDVPPLLKPGQIAKACGWTYKVTITELRNAGLLEGDAEGKPWRWRVSASRLRERLPDVYARVFRVLVLKHVG